MNTKQLKLFQNVLEQAEENLLENLNSDVEDHAFDDAQYCLDGLRHVGALLDNIDIDNVPLEIIGLGYNDIEWLANDIVNDRGGDAEFIRECNDDICSGEDCEAVIEELKNV